MNVMPIDSQKVFFASCFFGIAWLFPEHFLPWISAGNEGLAIFGLFLLTFLFWLGPGTGSEFNSSKPLLLVLIVCSISISGQYMFGKLYFGGDAVLALMYLSVWYLAVLVGRFLATTSNADEVMNALITPWVIAAMFCVGLALTQLTGAQEYITWAIPLQHGWRPYANLGQPNHFSTVCYLGLTGLFWLHQTKRIRGAVLSCGLVFMLLGIVIAQSRTAWLQIAVLIVVAVFFHRRTNLRVGQRGLLLTGIIFSAGVLIFPSVMEALLLTLPRSLEDQMRESARLHFWGMMMDALGREPLWGYGWLQVGTAHQNVALDHPAIGVLFQNSHNFVLDMFIWSGLPLGGSVLALLCWWAAVRIKACTDARIVWLMLLISGIAIHGMLEFPLEYAYFLIPVGLCMGAIDGYTASVQNTVQLPRKVVSSCIAVLVCVFAWVSVEYFRADENYRTLRLEAAHIGVTRMETPAAELQILTQLSAFLKFVRMESMTNLAPDQLEWMRQVSLRYGYVPTLLKYALAAGLNGQAVEANKALGRVCSMTTDKLCTESKESWKATQKSHSELQSIPFPEE